MLPAFGKYTASSITQHLSLGTSTVTSCTSSLHLSPPLTSRTTLYLGKVRAHIGVPGNEEADLLAGIDARRPEQCTHHTPLSPPPFFDLYWPHLHTGSSPTPLKSLKKLPTLTPHLDYKKPGIYKQAWQDLQPHIHKHSKEYIHKQHLPFPTLKTVIKYWGGSIWTNKMAKRCGRSRSSLCPLCGMEDSAGHLLGECSHDHIKGYHCQRHDNTVYRLCKILRLSKDPSICRSLLQADAKASHGRLLEGTESELPSWLLPQLSRHNRQKFRPDILCMALDSKHNIEGEDYLQVIKQHATFHLLEVGYGGDTFYTTTYDRKKAQHTHLLHLLRAEGWKVSTPDALIFGHGGTTYEDTWKTLVQKYQIPTHIVDKFFNKTQREAARIAHQIIISRRLAENKKRK